MLLLATIQQCAHLPAGTVVQLEVPEGALAAALASVSPAPGSAPAPASEGKQRLSMEDMVDRYDVDARTIRRWVTDKKVPFFKIGGKLFFHASDLDAIEEAVKIKARGTVPMAVQLRAERQAA